jgi:hypothetical protein
VGTVAPPPLHTACMPLTHLPHLSHLNCHICRHGEPGRTHGLAGGDHSNSVTLARSAALSGPPWQVVNYCLLCFLGVQSSLKRSVIKHALQMTATLIQSTRCSTCDVTFQASLFLPLPQEGYNMVQADEEATGKDR